MNEYFVTFGSQYNPKQERHPYLDVAHRDGWVTVVAETYDQARAEVERRLGTRWSMLYGADGFEPDYFPLGELARWNAVIPMEPMATYPCWQVRELFDRARAAGGADVAYADAEHAAHGEHLHEERGVLMTCRGYVDRLHDLQPSAPVSWEVVRDEH